MNKYARVWAVIVADERKFHVFSSFRPQNLPNKDTNVNYLFESIVGWFDGCGKKQKKIKKNRTHTYWERDRVRES